MWKIVRCSVCGKKGRIKINDETGKIESHWAYFGKVHLGDKEVDYFECPKCNSKTEFTLEDYIELERKGT